MSVRLDSDIVRLEGECHLEEAERLVALLCETPGRGVDLTGCRRLHAAVLQALLSLGPPLFGIPDDPFLRDFVLPNMRLEMKPVDEPTGPDQNLES